MADVVFDSLGFVTRKKQREVWAMGRTLQDEQIRDGLLPEPVRISERLSGWPPHELAAIRQARIAGSTEDEIRALVCRLVAARTEPQAA